MFNKMSNEIIPKWIYNSEFYQCLLDEYKNDEFPRYTLDVKRIFEFPDVINIYNIGKICENVRFFGIKEDYYLLRIFDYIMRLHTEYKLIFKQMFPELTIFWNSINISSCYQAAESNNLFALKYLHYKEKPWNSKVTAVVSKNIKILKYLHERECPWDEKTCYYSIVNKNMESLKYAHEHGCPWDYHSMVESVYFSFECLKYLHEKGCPWNEAVCSTIAKIGNLKMLEYAYEHGCPWNENTCMNAAANGHLDCLKYAVTLGCKIGFLSCEYAASNGHLECFKYLHEHRAYWNSDIFYVCAFNGHLNCFQYANEHIFENLNSIQKNEDVCACAAEKGNLNILIYAHENGFPWDRKTVQNAKRNKHMDCLKYALDNGCPK
jgi:hypothetical protein